MRVSVCIPTYQRPDQVRALMSNILQQKLPPDEVVVVDSSPDDATDKVVKGFAGKLPVVYQRSEKGLTLQRNRAIDLSTGDILVFLDDDVVLQPDLLREVWKFFSSDPQGTIGGVTAVQLNRHIPGSGLGWKLKRLLGVVETDEPGRLLACGETTPLPRPETGQMLRVDFLPGWLAAWRRNVFDEFRYSLFFQGYGLGEDKYFSASVAKKYALYIHGNIKAEHLHVAGNRPDYFRWGYFNVFNHCFIMKECSAGRFKLLRFFLFHAIDAGNDLLTWPFRASRLRTLLYGCGRLAGLVRCAFVPPTMPENDPALRNRFPAATGAGEAR